MTDVFTDESGEQVCPECQTPRYTFQLTGHKGVNMCTDPRRYDVITTFRRELLQFQGKEKVYVSDEVYEKLNQHFMSLGMPSADEIRRRPLDEFGKTLGTNLNALLEGLKETGHPSLYKHANKIGSKLWGWKLHDLKDLTMAIVQDFIDIQKQFPHVEKKRSSNICSQHRLLQQLRLRDVKVTLSDFKLPGLTALLESEEIYKKMVERTHHPYLPLFPEQETLTAGEGFLIVNRSSNTVVETQ